jgi:transposase
MSAPQIDMHRLQEAVRLHRLGNSRRSIAGSLKMGRVTLRRYLAALEAAGLLDGDPADLPDLSKLRAAADAGVPSKAAAQTRSSVSTWTGDIERLHAGGAGPTAIHDYLRVHASGYAGSVSAVKRFCRQLAKKEGPKATDVAIPVVTLPGDVAQVDFCYGGKRYDPATKVMRKTWIFIMTLGHSRATYAEFVFDQKVETWVRIHINAFEHFGGVPRVVVPDNLKAAVIRYAFGGEEGAVLNRSYRELARAYGFQIDPTPVRSPEKKGKVERDAQYIEKNFLTTLGEVDVPESQRLLLLWLREVAGRRCHGTTKRAPLDVFEAEEKSELCSLPAARWRPVIWKRVTVHRDSHVQVAGALYSAPWKYLHRSI